MEHEVLSRGHRWQHEDHCEVFEDSDVLDGAEHLANMDFEEWKKTFVIVSGGEK